MWIDFRSCIMKLKLWSVLVMVRFGYGPFWLWDETSGSALIEYYRTFGKIDGYTVPEYLFTKDMHAVTFF